MDKLSDSVHARTLHSEKKKEMCTVSEISGHIEMWRKFISWIAKWQVRSRTTRKPLYVASKTGWIITLKAFIGISEVLLKKMKFILTGRFSQDTLENTSASIRRRGGFRDNPDVNEFCQQIQKVIITNFINSQQEKNWQVDEAYSIIDFSCFNKNELLEVIDSDDCVTESENEVRNLSALENVHDVDGLNFSTLDNVEENVLSYISGYLAQ
ncbi:unnamed protein product [Larinioides sclopetarius]|uniref:Uncharacterized protein n=1 Tax=Larinioides sclopetarius TaxID=280406 RepID=A0AAV2AD44_9ARAC